MRSFLLITMAICAFTFQSWACLGPENIQGVAFTSGETIDLQKLMKMGTVNVNYFKDYEDSAIGIRYMSHYDSRAMVFIGNYGLSYMQNMRIACMGVILPIASESSVYTPISKETFDFSAAVKKELEWLVYNGIINISYKTIAAIDSSFSYLSPFALERGDKARNGGMQYWTHANRVLAYNSWYDYDTISGTWSEKGADGVRSVNGLEGCSAVKPGVGLPPASLGTTAIFLKPVALSHGLKPLAVRRSGNGALIVFLPNAQRTTVALLTVINSRGALVCTKHVPLGVRSLYINGLAFGHYTARLLQ